MRVASSRLAFVVVLAMLPVLVAACGIGNRQSTGALVGPITGSIPGAGRAPARAATAASGAVIGGISSNAIGRRMDERERRIAANAEYRAMEYGRSDTPLAWDDPTTRHRGSIVPARPYQQGSQYCRSYVHTIYAGGAPQISKGTACRESNGTWRSVG